MHGQTGPKAPKPEKSTAGTGTCTCDAAGPDDLLFKRQARVLRALANASRLKIIDRLSRGDCSVGELTRLVGSDRSTVSKHLAVLRSHGIVDDRREGNSVYYSLLTPCVLSFFACASRVLDGDRT